MDTISVQGGEVKAQSVEGAVASMPVCEFVERLSPRRLDTGGLVLPNGVKCVASRGRASIVVLELAPRVACLRWIAANSPAPFGHGASYRDVTIALPYVIIVAVFSADPAGPPGADRLQLTRSNECFFRTAPLTGPGDELLYPALLNCSKWAVATGHPLSWICTQHLDFASLAAIADGNARMRASLLALVQCLLGTGFNLSSEHHEGNSWFSYTVGRGIDPRISSIETWEQATRQDPLFCLDVPWLPTGRSLEQVCDRAFGLQKAAGVSLASAEDLARIVFNSGRKAAS